MKVRICWQIKNAEKAGGGVELIPFYSERTLRSKQNVCEFTNTSSACVSGRAALPSKAERPRLLGCDVGERFSVTLANLSRPAPIANVLVG